MTPLLADGAVIEALPADCMSITRGDLLVFRSAASSMPVIKRVVAEPGDAFAIHGAGSSSLSVNRVLQCNSIGHLYEFDADAEKMLKLYERDYSGRVPAGTYLVLGESTGGSLDSSRLGLVNKQDVVAVARLEATFVCR